MKCLNKVHLIGHLGRDPEFRVTQNNQTSVANISLATSDSWKDKQTGDKQERTEWHRVVCWAKLAEIARDHCFKGNKIYVEGKLQTRSFEADGVKRYTTEIVASNIIFLDSPNGDHAQPESSKPASSRKSRAQGFYEPPTSGFDNFDDDDIPF